MGFYIIFHGKPGLFRNGMPDNGIEDSAVPERKHAGRSDAVDFIGQMEKWGGISMVFFFLDNFGIDDGPGCHQRFPFVTGQPGMKNIGKGQLVSRAVGVVMPVWQLQCCTVQKNRLHPERTLQFAPELLPQIKVNHAGFYKYGLVTACLTGNLLRP